MQATTMQLEKKVYNTTECAEVLGISRPKMYELARSKGFPSVRIGAKIVIPICKLNEWLDAQASQNMCKGA